ncbi:MAG: hypothetical protein ABFC94_18550 [Syntrophomonas sp.]
MRNNHASKNTDDLIRVKGGMPAIVSKEDFAAVQAKMARNKRQPGFYKAKELYLLSGLIFCGDAVMPCRVIPESAVEVRNAIFHTAAVKRIGV